MDLFLVQLALVTYLFGPAVAIPFAGWRMDIVSTAFFVLFLQAVTIFLLFHVLEFVDYNERCNKRILRKVCEITKREVEEIGKNTEVISSRFRRGHGHHGYYTSLFFLSFALGFSWAVLISYSLKLRRIYSYSVILLGSAFSFVFWYLVLLFSLNFVTAELFTLLSICLGLFLFFYGKIKEREELYRVAKALRSARKKTGSLVKKRIRRTPER